MKKPFKQLLLGFTLAVVGGLLAISENSIFFYSGLLIAAVGIIVITFLYINRTGP